MLLHLPPIDGRDGPRIKNGPALTGHGAEAARDAISAAIVTLPNKVHLTDKLLRRSVESGQYTSFAFTRRLIDASADASVGSVGDGYDNALAETTIGLFKTEKINREGPWRTLADVELATLEWVDWFNHRRLHSACGGRPPAELEEQDLHSLERQQRQ